MTNDNLEIIKRIKELYTSEQISASKKDHFLSKISELDEYKLKLQECLKTPHTGESKTFLSESGDVSTQETIKEDGTIGFMSFEPYNWISEKEMWLKKIEQATAFISKLEEALTPIDEFIQFCIMDDDLKKRFKELGYDYDITMFANVHAGTKAFDALEKRGTLVFNKEKGTYSLPSLHKIDLCSLSDEELVGLKTFWKKLESNILVA